MRVAKASRLFRWIDNYLADKIYPYEYFSGGELYGHPSHVPYFRHNREIDALRVACRKLAVRFNDGPYT